MHDNIWAHFINKQYLMSEKRERFKRLASHRTNVVIDRIRVLGNCANNGAYEYTQEDIRKIFNAIDTALSGVKAKFKKPINHKFEL